MADYEKPKENELPTKDPYEDPEYVPKSYGEIIKAAEERALRAIETREQTRLAEQKAIEDEVVGQLQDIKRKDPTLDENSLFVHANKYGFRDLNLAYQNMKDMSETVKKVQAETARNIAKRSDPVSATPGAGGQKLDPDSFPNALEYLRALKG